MDYGRCEEDSGSTWAWFRVTDIVSLSDCVSMFMFSTWKLNYIHTLISSFPTVAPPATPHLMSPCSAWGCPSGACLFAWCHAAACGARRRRWHRWTTPTAAWRLSPRRSSASRRPCWNSTSTPTRSRSCLKWDPKAWRLRTDRKKIFKWNLKWIHFL